MLARTDRGLVSIVTGGESGIGSALCRRLARNGNHVVSLDRAVPRERSGGTDGNVTHLFADVGDEASVEAAVELVSRRFGVVDQLVNAAGVVGTTSRVDRLEPSQWSEVIGVNLTGAFLTMRGVVPLMLESDSAAIVNVASVAARRAPPHHIAYAASKAGLLGATRAAAVDLAPLGVRVNAVCPGYTSTPMLEQSRGSDDLRVIRAIPLGRMATADEIAGVIEWLLSDEAAYLTGASISADGGITAG